MREQEQTIEVTEEFSFGQPQEAENQKSDWEKLKGNPGDFIMSAFAIAVQIFVVLVFFAGFVTIVALLASLIIARTSGG